MKIFIGYASTHGSTARIAERLAQRLREAGAVPLLVDLRTLRGPVDLARYGAVVLGGRVQGARYPRALTTFVRRNLRVLRAVPAAFFSVSLLQLSRIPAQREATLALPVKRMTALGWHPDEVEVIAGALSWTRYARLGRPIMKAIWTRALGSVDTSHDQIFTDWRQVDRFALKVVELAGGGLPLERPSEIPALEFGAPP